MDKAANRGRLFIVCGLPGAGKTTFARKLAARNGAIRFCPDEWMEALELDLYDERRRSTIEALQWTISRQFLKLGGKVIIEWGTWARSERDQLRLEAQRLGAAVELHYLTAPLDVLMDRLDKRAAETPPITKESMERWISLFQEPTSEEFSLFDAPAE